MYCVLVLPRPCQLGIQLRDRATQCAEFCLGTLGCIAGRQHIELQFLVALLGRADQRPQGGDLCTKCCNLDIRFHTDDVIPRSAAAR